MIRNPWYNGSYPAQSRAQTYYAYDASGRTLACENYWDTLTSGTNTYGTSTTTSSNDCTYDIVLGLKTAASFSVPTIGSWTEGYGYDPQLDYLTSYQIGTNSPQTWQYDAARNRTDSVCDNLNRTITVGGVSTNCDILGNRASLGSNTTYTWDCLNRMTGLVSSGTTSSYQYRADGMRVHKQVGSVTTDYYHDGQMPMEDAVINGSNLTVTRYAIGARGIDYMEQGVGTYTGGVRTPGAYSTVVFPIYDAHGNMIATLGRASGNSYNTYNARAYDAWGNIRVGQGSGDPKNRYCGQLGHQQDDESGLIYMRARYYEPGSGRFISEDPSTNGANWFTYCNADPVNAIDQDGRKLQTAWAWFLAGLVLFITGYFLLFNGVIPDLAARLDHVEWMLKQIPENLSDLPLADDAKLLYEQQRSSLQLEQSRIGNMSGILKLVGYMMVLTAMLIDTQLAGQGEGWDILGTLFG